MLNFDFLSEEEQFLYNPAYVGFLLHIFIASYTKKKPEGMHCALAYIAIPMAMNPYINSNLPRSISTPISAWISKNEGILSDFPSNARAYNKIISAAISFLLHRDLLHVNSYGYLVPQSKSLRIPKQFGEESHGMASAISSSKFLGRWFSQAPSPETIFIQLGVRP
ncbi:three component ABC system middle component [Aeromonas salmonicida]